MAQGKPKPPVGSNVPAPINVSQVALIVPQPITLTLSLTPPLTHLLDRYITVLEQQGDRTEFYDKMNSLLDDLEKLA